MEHQRIVTSKNLASVLPQYKQVEDIHCLLRDVSPSNILRGDPGGGEVYLRIILSPEQASRMWVFLNTFFLHGGVCSQLAQTPSWRTTPRQLSATAYSIYSQLASLPEAVPLSATWGHAMPCWQGPTTWYQLVYHRATKLSRTQQTETINSVRRFTWITTYDLCATQYRHVVIQIQLWAFIAKYYETGISTPMENSAGAS